MRLTYIFHSGFMVETDRSVLVFDYWMDPSGVMKRYIPDGRKVYVFSSHFHEDHFNREIFSWRERYPEITYILSKDILKRRRASKEEADVWLAKRGIWEDGNIRVTAAGSNDSGVSWIVETAGLRIFHAGDLNNWFARFLAEMEGNDRHARIFSTESGCPVDPVREEKLFLGELKDIRKICDSFDVAMFPVDGRIGNGYTRGPRQFLDMFRVGLLVPMHFVASGFESAWRMKEFAEEKGVSFWCISREGEDREL